MVLPGTDHRITDPDTARLWLSCGGEERLAEPLFGGQADAVEAELRWG